MESERLRARIAGAAAADSAGLVYVNDDTPGICRRRQGTGFSYADADGKRITDPAVLARIRSLAIPPAWTHVWVSTEPGGHLQAAGRDARGRKQYIYHTRWREVRDSNKFVHMLDFAQALPRIRRRIMKDMSRRGLPRDKVLATMVNLLEQTLVRVGNGEYAAHNKSYGLTTLRDRHAAIDGAELRFTFVGKSGRHWRLKLRDRRIAGIVKRCQDIPGQRLFQYLDSDGIGHPVTSSDVNAYLRDAAGAEVSTKDYRTWSATVLAAGVLAELGPFRSQAEARANVKEAIERAADRLGNTPAVCRKCYVHPDLIARYLKGALIERLARPAIPRAAPAGLEPWEKRVYAALGDRAHQSKRRHDKRPPAARGRLNRPVPARGPARPATSRRSAASAAQ